MFKNKETIVGWVLIVVLMLGFVFYQTKKSKEEAEQKKLEAAKTKQTVKIDSAAVAQKPAVNNPATPDTVAVNNSVTIPTDSASLQNEFGEFANDVKGEEQIFTLENDLLKIDFSNKGAQIKSVQLKKYKTWDGKPLILFTDKTNSLSYQFSIQNNRVIDTKNFFFEKNSSDDSSVAFRLNAGDGKFIEQKFLLHANSYMLDYSLKFEGLKDVIPSNNNIISVNWNNTLASLERDVLQERRYSAVYYKYKTGDVTHLSEDSEKDEAAFEDSPLEWISFKQQFFNATLLSNGDFKYGKLESHFGKDDKGYVKKYTAKFSLPFNAEANENSYSFQYFFGPNHFNTLSAYNRDLESIIKIGPDMWIFRWMKYITRFFIIIFNWFDKLHWNYGIIILIMTLLLKLILHPFTAKSIESAAKMKLLQPELTALKEKYGEDQAKIGQEQMKLYQRAGVNPLGGCLPLLFQMPILIAMYNFFPASIELRQQAFLWAKDLSSYDDLIRFGTAIPLFGEHLSLFTVLMTITSVIQAVMSSNLNSMNNQQPGMKYMPYIMPVMLMFIFNSFPAALTYYYLLMNLLGVAHQWIIQKFFIDEKKLHKQMEENRKNPPKKSGLMERIEQMQKASQQARKAK